MKDTLFHLPNEELEDLETGFASFFYVHTNTAICFCIYGSLQALNCDI